MTECQVCHGGGIMPNPMFGSALTFGLIFPEPPIMRCWLCDGTGIAPEKPLNTQKAPPKE